MGTFHTQLIFKAVSESFLIHCDVDNTLTGP